MSLGAATSYALEITLEQTDTASSAQLPTAQGWRELLSGGTPFLGRPEEMHSDIENLENFLAHPPAAVAEDDRRYLESALSRLQKLALIQAGFAQCAAKRGKPLPYLDRVLAGARSYAQVDCGLSNPSVSDISSFKELARNLGAGVPIENKKEAQEVLRKLARERAMQNIGKLKAQVQSANAAELAANLSQHLAPLAKEVAHIKQTLNSQLKGHGALADKKAHELFEQNSSRYDSIYTAMINSPNGSLVLTKSLAEKIGLPRTADDIEVTQRGSIRGESFIRIDIPNHPSSISETDVREALQGENNDLGETYRELESNQQISLKDLTLRFPVSVGESLMESHADNLPDLIHDLCRIAVGESMRENMKKNLIKIVDVSLAASILVTGAGGITASLLRREALKRALLAGTASAAATADAVSIAQFTYSKTQKDEILELARQNPAIVQNPEEMNRLEKALKEFEETKKKAILTGATSTVGAIGAFKIARLFAKKGDDLVTTVKAATNKTRKGTDALDEAIGRALTGCP